MKMTLETKVRLGIATEADFKSLGHERVVAIKSAHDKPHFRGMRVRMVAAPPGYGDRHVIRGIASTEDRDHYGDVVRVRGRGEGKGWLLEHYKAQGSPVLWSHGISPFGGGLTDVPIAQGIKTWRGRAVSRGETKKALIQDLEFLSADAGAADHFLFSDGVYRILSGEGTQSGIGMMGFSVGFIPVRANSPGEAEEREKLGLGPYGVEFTEQILIENTVTPTPANPFASVIGGGQKAFEREFDAMLDRGKIPASLAKDFKRLAFGADAAEEELQSRLHKRVFFLSEVDEEAGVSETSPVFDVDTIRRAIVDGDDSDHPVEFQTPEVDDPDDDDDDQNSDDVEERSVEAEAVSSFDATAIRTALEGAVTQSTKKGESEAEPDAVVLHITPKGYECLRRGLEALDLGYSVLDTLFAAVEDGQKDLDWGASIDLRSQRTLLSDLVGELRRQLRLEGDGQSGGPKGSQTGDADRKPLSQAAREVIDAFAAKSPG